MFRIINVYISPLIMAGCFFGTNWGFTYINNYSHDYYLGLINPFNTYESLLFVVCVREVRIMLPSEMSGQ